MAVLNIMLAKAINLQDRSGAAQIRETLRCISLLEKEVHGKLILRLREEHRARSPYIAYLVRSRQGLLANQATLDSLSKRMEIEQRMSSKFLITVCVRSDLSQDSQGVIFPSQIVPGEERRRAPAVGCPVLRHQHDGREDGAGGAVPQQDVGGARAGADVRSDQRRTKG